MTDSLVHPEADRLERTVGEDAEKDLTEETLEVLSGYDWPGNVRELENALERAVVVAAGSVISPDQLPERVLSADSAPLVSDQLPPNPYLDVIERAYIHWVLTAEGGNKSRAAEVLGIDPSSLHLVPQAQSLRNRRVMLHGSRDTLRFRTRVP